MTLLRPFVAYLAATFAAVGSVILVDAFMLAGDMRGRELLRSLTSPIPIYALYGLGFTLVLGLAGLVLLHQLRRRRWFVYAALGAGLGFVTAGLGDGFGIHNSFLVIFTVAGAAAASAFYCVRFADESRGRRDAPRTQ